jgi:hypothetical protein
MREILGGELEKVFEEQGINAVKTYEGNTHLDSKTQIWELSNDEFEKLCNIDEDEWDEKYKWSWWNSAEGSNMDNPISRFNINHHYIQAWDGDGRLEALEEVNGNTSHDDYCYEDRKYKDLLGYLCDEIGASMGKNVVALAVDLAVMNNMKMSELFKKYQGYEEEK